MDDFTQRQADEKEAWDTMVKILKDHGVDIELTDEVKDAIEVWGWKFSDLHAGGRI